MMSEPWEPFDAAFDFAITVVKSMSAEELPSAYEKWSQLDQREDRVLAMVQVLKCVISQNPDLHTVH